MMSFWFYIFNWAQKSTKMLGYDVILLFLFLWPEGILKIADIFDPRHPEKENEQF